MKYLIETILFGFWCLVCTQFSPEKHLQGYYWCCIGVVPLNRCVTSRTLPYLPRPISLMMLKCSWISRLARLCAVSSISSSIRLPSARPSSIIFSRNKTKASKSSLLFNMDPHNYYIISRLVLKYRCWWSEARSHVELKIFCLCTSSHFVVKYFGDFKLFLSNEL